MEGCLEQDEYYTGAIGWRKHRLKFDRKFSTEVKIRSHSVVIPSRVGQMSRLEKAWATDENDI